MTFTRSRPSNGRSASIWCIVLLTALRALVPAACCLVMKHLAVGAPRRLWCLHAYDWDLKPTQCVVTLGNSSLKGKAAASCPHSRVA